jgi:hypothetical protein
MEGEPNKLKIIHSGVCGTGMGSVNKNNNSTVWLTEGVFVYTANIINN